MVDVFQSACLRACADFVTLEASRVAAEAAANLITVGKPAAEVPLKLQPFAVDVGCHLFRSETTISVRMAQGEYVVLTYDSMHQHKGARIGVPVCVLTNYGRVLHVTNDLESKNYSYHHDTPDPQRIWAIHSINAGTSSSQIFHLDGCPIGSVVILTAVHVELLRELTQESRRVHRGQDGHNNYLLEGRVKFQNRVLQYVQHVAASAAPTILASHLSELDCKRTELDAALNAARYSQAAAEKEREEMRRKYENKMAVITCEKEKLAQQQVKCVVMRAFLHWKQCTIATRSHQNQAMLARLRAREAGLDMRLTMADVVERCINMASTLQHAADLMDIDPAAARKLASEMIACAKRIN